MKGAGPTDGTFSSQLLLWVSRAFPVYKFGNKNGSNLGGKRAWVLDSNSYQSLAEVCSLVCYFLVIFGFPAGQKALMLLYRKL